MRKPKIHPGYLKVSVDFVLSVPKGSSVSDFEGLVSGGKVLKRARKVWDMIVECAPEEDPKLWTLWIHWVHGSMDTGNYDGEIGENLHGEVLVAMSTFLGKDAGVFLKESVK